jgi:phosphoglycolate phosphatase-like HAD superfamily hydrolase
LLKAKYGLKEGVNYLVERSESMRLRIIEKEATPADGLEDLLKLLLGKGIKLGVASNSPSDYVHAALGAIRVRHFFDCVLSVDDVEMHGDRGFTLGDEICLGSRYALRCSP